MKKEKIIRSVRKVKFMCISCENRVTMEDGFIEWEYHTSYGLKNLHKYYCSECSGLLLPIEDERMNKVDWVYESWFNGDHKELFRVFSSCPNAEYCESIDRYNAKCEHKQIDKECLSVIVGNINYLLEKQEEIMSKLDDLKTTITSLIHKDDIHMQRS